MAEMKPGPTGDPQGEGVEELRGFLAETVAIAIGLFLGCFVLGAGAGWGAWLIGRKPLSGMFMIVAALIGLGFVIWRFYATSRPRFDNRT